MTARYYLTLQAKQDLAEIAEYIAAEGGLEAAASVVERFRESFGSSPISRASVMFARTWRKILG
ncbi:MAG TPA: type II toxin-antitoxin system RelE/ParE family toxin [Planctomycetota bacterium]|nr:type II toxin-antitoxin system RelE/ParE family toxin [Planctomycetota bacterium]